MVRIEGESFRVNFILSQSKTFETMRLLCLNYASGYLLCYAINDRESFDELQNKIEELMRVRDMSRDELRAVPMVFIATKADLDDFQVPNDEGMLSREFADQNFMRVLLVSAESRARPWRAPILHLSEVRRAGICGFCRAVQAPRCQTQSNFVVQCGSSEGLTILISSDDELGISGCIQCCTIKFWGVGFHQILYRSTHFHSAPTITKNVANRKRRVEESLRDCEVHRV